MRSPEATAHVYTLEDPDPSDSGNLDKLAQLPQNLRRETIENLQKRRRAKRFTLPVVRELVELDSEINRYYERAADCCQVIRQEDGQLQANYCKSRCCIVCNRIRAGRLINDYQHIFNQWEGRYMVTLTVPSCSGEELDGMLDRMLKQFNLCKRSIKRTRELRFEAVRVTEATWNAQHLYHPHFHVIFRDRAAAEAMIEEWMKRWSDAVRSAQDLTKWGGDPKDIKELAKYCTKITKRGGDGEMAYPAEVLDTIFRALHGRRMWQPIGFRLGDYGIEEDPEELETIEQQTPAIKRWEESILWVWEAAVGDWVDQTTGEMLLEGCDLRGG